MVNRIMIIGGPGSGKSTLARRLGDQTGLPVHHIDKIHFLPGWVERPHDDRERMLAAIHQSDQWILEGNYSRTWPDRLARADVAVFLDVPIWTRLWRILLRTWRTRGQVRPDLADGCPEVLGWQTIAFMWWVFRHRKAHQMGPLVKAKPFAKTFVCVSDAKTWTLSDLP